MTPTSARTRWPVVARWTQSTDGGIVNWYLAGLREDRGFWGYVHYRTSGRQDNRSFSGTLDNDTFARVASIVEEFDQNRLPDQTPAESDAFDALIGIGIRSSFRRVFELPSGAVDSVDSRSVMVFREFVDLLQPTLVDAVARGYDDCIRDR